MGQKKGFPLNKEVLQQLYDTLTIKEIAEQIGMSQETVRRTMVRHGIARKRSGPRPEFLPSIQDLDALYQQMSMQQIARRYGVGQTAVWKKLKEYGIVLRDYENGGHRKKPGRVFSEEHRRKIGIASTGRKSNWKGGLTEIHAKLRRSGAYKQWKLASLAKSQNKCEQCGKMNGEICECCGTKIVLHVHHIKSFAKFPETRFDPENSEVLCPKCHYSRHNGKTG